MRLQAAIARLEEVQAELPPQGSLRSPDHHATALPELGRLYLQEVPEGLRSAWCQTLIEAARAQVRHFPENLFGDLDALAGHLHRGVVHGQRDRAWLEQLTQLWEQLHAVFGIHSSVRFRYVHDFLYGYDWAKWVKRDVDARRTIGPYDLPFLESLLARGHELLQAIAAGTDEDYPALKDERPRNVFTFSREPADEERLLRTLAGENALPLRAWEPDATGNWQASYAKLRLQAAKRLGVVTRPGAKPEQ